MTLQSWRKAYGALKDHTTVGLAQINSDFKDLDVAIVKATNHVERPPNERHLRKILLATSSMRPRADVAYCIHALARRLAKTHNWTVALKTLIVIHRGLREGDPTFREELLNFHLRGHILQIANFKDDSSPIAWDYSGWLRTYALYLEERLECFRVLKYDIEAERLSKPSQGQDKGFTRARELESEELLEHLPALQQLLYRLIGCRPEGAAFGNYVIQYALAMILKESFKIYCTINDGIINLVDKFFEMPRHEALKALDVYKRAGQQAASLSDFYEVCKGLELARNFQFPVLREPPQSFVATMEEYITDAPRMMSVPAQTLEYPERLLLTYKPEEESPLADDGQVPAGEHKPVPLDDEISAPSQLPLQTPPPPPNNFDTDDLLGLNTISQHASAIEESNALALAIIPSGTTSDSNAAAFSKDLDPTGWELALVTTPSNNLSSDQHRELAGGLDSLTLNSLYDEAAYRGASQQPTYGAPAHNPFDPFGMSNTVVPPHASAQMATSTTLFQHQIMNPFGPVQPSYMHPALHPYPHPYQHQHQMMAAQNPFGDSPYNAFPAHPVVGQPQTTNNPFGSTGLL